MLTNPAAYTLPSGATATAMKRSCSLADIGEAAMPLVPNAASTAPAVVVGPAATLDVGGVVVSAAPPPSPSSSPHAASASAPTNRAPASFFKITLRVVS